MTNYTFLRTRYRNQGIKRSCKAFSFSLMFDNQKTTSDKMAKTKQTAKKANTQGMSTHQNVSTSSSSSGERWTLTWKGPGGKVINPGTTGPYSQGKKGKSPRLLRENE